MLFLVVEKLTIIILGHALSNIGCIISLLSEVYKVPSFHLHVLSVMKQRRTADNTVMNNKSTKHVTEKTLYEIDKKYLNRPKNALRLEFPT